MTTIKKNECFEVVKGSSPYAKNTSNPVRTLITCEHAAVTLPPDYSWSEEDKRLVGTHWSCDPGAAEFSKELSELISAPALLHGVSRLLLDPNRPINSDTMFRTVAEGKPILLNQNIDDKERSNRIRRFYEPYHNELKYLTELIDPSLIIAIHSFTPDYEGQKRKVEVGVLFNHHSEPAMRLCTFLQGKGFDTRLNEPWSGKDGFMYAASSMENDTRKGIMLEFRQDLILDSKWRQNMVHLLSQWISESKDLWSN